MIDTIRFRIPYTGINKSVYDAISCSVITFTPDGQELRKYFKFIPYDELTSQFEHIYMNVFSNFIYFEFSLHKFINRHKLGISYNHNNYTIITDYLYFIKFLKLLNEIGYEINLKSLEVMRIDIGLNYRLEGEIDVLDFFEIIYLQMGKFSKIKTNQFRTSCYYPSRWVTKKLYSKYYDLKHILANDIEKRKDEKYLNLMEKIKNVIRLELSIKRQKLKSMGITGNFSLNMLSKIKDYFEGEKVNILKFEDYFKKGGKNKLSLIEQYIIETVIEYGYNYAKELFIKEKSKRTFYRVQKNLKEKGINLKSLVREYKEGKVEIEINNINIPEFELKVI